MTQDEKRADMVRGLRLAADMLADINTPLPYQVELEVYWQTNADGTLGDSPTPELARATMGRTPGGWSKEYSGGLASYVRKLTDTVNYQLHVPRERVCRRIVTGTKTIPARDVEVVEWQCAEGM